MTEMEWAELEENLWAEKEDQGQNPKEQQHLWRWTWRGVSRGLIISDQKLRRTGRNGKKVLKRKGWLGRPRL